MAAAFDWLNTTLLISDSASAIYTNAASTTTFITNILLHNTDSSAIDVTLYFVPDSSGSVGTAAAGNQFFKQTLAANETFPINDVTQIFGDTNDTLQAVAGTASKVTIFVNGAKQT